MRNKETELAAVHVAVPLWLRGPITLTSDRWLVLDRARAATYRPTTDVPRRANVFDLANIHQPKDAVRFAEQHGLLWHGPDAEDLLESFTDWWYEANDLRKILSLYLAWQQAQAGTGSIRELRGWLGQAQGLHDADVLAQAAALVVERISQKLAACPMRLAANMPTNGAAETFSLGPATASPLHHVYFQLAQLLVNDVPLATCAEPLCARFFDQSDRRQHYCSPTCANRARQRRWAQRARSARPGHTNTTHE